MSDADLSDALLHANRSIEAYAQRCRNRIPTFVARHFSWEQTWDLQRPTLWVDLVLAALNAMWAIPYLTIKKVCNGLEALGFKYAADLLAYLPRGIKTGYQRQVEALIGRELLEWNLVGDVRRLPEGLAGELNKSRVLREVSFEADRHAVDTFRATVENFSAGRALVSSVAGTLLTIGCGWLLLGNTSAALGEIADQLARRNAHDRAAARFVLGRRAGSVFYNLFRPPASQSETVLILVALFATVTAGSLLCAVASDPLRKLLGLHQRRLSALVDSLERELVLFSQKHLGQLLAGAVVTAEAPRP